ncbi:peptidoglycan DD-metalloendopeptidase family protein [Enterovibrio paralichthyis]|uniref:peptidoglycan DD-metalloendopeptidase family protein n=1 Tax=Enterovibrio paralichthyis TaxID=2853805 RepID=UPI001C483E86|nr:peptidoglycan DD-metalloendopeptidase family protein [Enterovibrio paralichthyis]MBV7298746.1 peptidoglycan DD-metalloendopeptidase family protein [Enterovibrio paralichthyis]
MKQRTLRHLPSFRASAALCAGVLLCLLASPAIQASDEQLSGMKSEISRQQQQLNANAKKLNSLQAELKSQEQSIASIAKQMREANASLAVTDKEIQVLNRESQRLEQLKLGQMELLKELLNSQYRQGEHSQLNALLSGKDTAKMDRMTVYAERLSKARTEAINELSATDTELQLKRHALEAQTAKQKALIASLAADKAKLEKEQSAQKKTASAIRRQINSDKGYLAELKDNQQRLTKELERAAEQARIAAEKARVKMDGLAKYKGRMQWPVKGKVLHSYGSAQSGQLRWNGMVIAAKEGSEVKAAHDGTVVLSNWLRGYGLMVVVDHGKGDMSFYGYNQALLKNVGDTVKAGDPIALVGNSGGQDDSALYFEIRRKGNATNPSPWLTR